MYSWKDRIADWWRGVMDGLELDRPDMIHIGLAIGISLILVALVIGIPLSIASRNISNQGIKLDDSIESIQTQLLTNYDAMNLTLQQTLNEQWAEIQNHAATYDAAIAEMQADLSVLAADHFAYVIGGWDNYLLCMKLDIDGQCTANIHLAYSPGIGNLTDSVTALNYFFAGVNWTESSVPAYQCAVSCNNTSWSIADVMFNIGMFELQPNIELVMPISCPGLNATWQPSYIYAEVYQLA